MKSRKIIPRCVPVLPKDFKLGVCYQPSRSNSSWRDCLLWRNVEYNSDFDIKKGCLVCFSGKPHMLYKETSKRGPWTFFPKCTFIPFNGKFTLSTSLFDQYSFDKTPPLKKIFTITFDNQ